MPEKARLRIDDIVVLEYKNLLFRNKFPSQIGLIDHSVKSLRLNQTWCLGISHAWRKHPVNRIEKKHPWKKVFIWYTFPHLCESSKNIRNWCRAMEGAAYWLAFTDCLSVISYRFPDHQFRNDLTRNGTSPRQLINN